MKLKNLVNVSVLLNTVEKCNSDVWLVSNYGDRYNLKSTLTQYVAVAALLGEHGEELELFCDNKTDENKFLDMFNEYPEMI